MKNLHELISDQKHLNHIFVCTSQQFITMIVGIIINYDLDSDKQQIND